MDITLREMQEYLFHNYGNRVTEQGLFMKLVEEIGEVAEVMNKKTGRKNAGDEDLQTQLGNELADVIHYAMAIAAISGIDMTDTVLGKDKTASLKYNHEVNMEQFILNSRLDK